MSEGTLLLEEPEEANGKAADWDVYGPVLACAILALVDLAWFGRTALQPLGGVDSKRIYLATLELRPLQICHELQDFYGLEDLPIYGITTDPAHPGPRMAT
ncbi:MAG: hypothetical protein JSS72_03450 [Armatimonadetes bacterium]|nr:hypothetical protein [Armatimonadota bacterium]